MDRSFPVLESLEAHRLKTAYLLLMLAARSGAHLQRLHDTVIEKHYRLPRDLFADIKGERERMVGRATRPNAMSDAEIRRAFLLAASGAHLHRFYWDRLLAARPNRAGTLDNNWNTHTHAFRAEDAAGHARQGFYAQWGAAGRQKATFHLRAAASEGGIRRLYARVYGRGVICEQDVNNFLAAPPWTHASGTEESFNFCYDLPLGPMESYADRTDPERPGIRLDHAGFAALCEYAESELGLTDITPDRHAEVGF